MRKLPIVEVLWEDAVTAGGWREPEGYKEMEPTEVRTVGYLLKTTRSVVTVVQSQHHLTYVPSMFGW